MKNTKSETNKNCSESLLSEEEEKNFTIETAFEQTGSFGRF